MRYSTNSLPSLIYSGVAGEDIVYPSKKINGILIAIPELALKAKAITTIITILFSGKNQLATNLEADINLNGNPKSDKS